MGTDVRGDGFIQVGPHKYLDRLLRQYGLDEAEVERSNGLRVESPTRWTPEIYSIERSFLRSHGEFQCAGDAEALDFCRDIAAEMVLSLGVSREEAVGRINNHWSKPGDDGLTPRVWIVGAHITYHETDCYWAKTIYYGHDSHWWRGEDGLEPLPYEP